MILGSRPGSPGLLEAWGHLVVIPGQVPFPCVSAPATDQESDYFSDPQTLCCGWAAGSETVARSTSRSTVTPCWTDGLCPGPQGGRQLLASTHTARPPASAQFPLHLSVCRLCGHVDTGVPSRQRFLRQSIQCTSCLLPFSPVQRRHRPPRQTAAQMLAPT